MWDLNGSPERMGDPVTFQFFPVNEPPAEEGSPGGEVTAAGFAAPRAHWAEVKFVEKAAEVSPAIKKSRRGPRSRSSQYRGVTFYRRTGRWESHIWLVLVSFSSQFQNR